MSSEIVESIARTILYEGYLLYPYRQSALKNQQRWNFGVLYPPTWTARQTGSDRSYFQMECLAFLREQALLEVSLRFLRIVERDEPRGRRQEATEQRVDVHALRVSELAARPHREKFSVFGIIQGDIDIHVTPLQERLFRLTMRVRNTGEFAAPDRQEALLHSLASAHAVLHLESGEFVSQIDPPETLREAVAACQNTGVWPVLVGENGLRDTMLGSPIILYDYPQVAPESKGDLFDGTEIDEILTLRILTLTDAEKDEIRRSDERARRLLERLEGSPPEDLIALHGTVRDMRAPANDAWSAWDTLDNASAASAVVSGIELRKGDRVRLRPQKRADIFDTVLLGKIAIIEAVEEDFEGRIHFAVVLEDDPGRDLGAMRQAGHRFFFSREEVEPLGLGNGQ